MAEQAAAVIPSHPPEPIMKLMNPLLRYEAFEPKAAGIRTLLPLVDAHLPVHNLDSLAALSQALAAMPVRAGHVTPAPRARRPATTALRP